MMRSSPHGWRNAHMYHCNDMHIAMVYMVAEHTNEPTCWDTYHNLHMHMSFPRAWLG